MKGKVLDFSVTVNEGIISGDDGRRYTFCGSEWRSRDYPLPQLRVDFATEADAAKAIFVDCPETVSQGGTSYASRPEPIRQNSETAELSRSGDQRVIAGVCAGLACKFGASAFVVRLIFVLSVFLWGFGILMYIILWLMMPARPTTN